MMCNALIYLITIIFRYYIPILIFFGIRITQRKLCVVKAFHYFYSDWVLQTLL